MTRLLLIVVWTWTISGGPLTSLLTFVLVCYGFTGILVWGKVFNRVRPDRKFFHCTQCVGFWVGALVTFLGVIVIIPQSMVLNMFLGGCLASGTSYILDKVFGDDGVNIN